MNIALIAATGNIGQRILNEALDRGHTVTALVRDPEKVTITHKNLSVSQIDIMNPDDVGSKISGHDAVVSAYGPGWTNVNLLVDATKSLIAGFKKATVPHLVAVGGSGSLEVAPGVQLVDTLPEEWKGIATAHRDTLALYKAEDELPWSYCSPAAYIEPGERTGSFRTGGTSLLVDAGGTSRISMEDFAIAIVDEVEKKAHLNRKFTVAY